MLTCKCRLLVILSFPILVKIYKMFIAKSNEKEESKFAAKFNKSVFDPCVYQYTNGCYQLSDQQCVIVR